MDIIKRKIEDMRQQATDSIRDNQDLLILASRFEKLINVDPLAPQTNQVDLDRINQALDSLKSAIDARILSKIQAIITPIIP